MHAIWHYILLSGCVIVAMLALLVSVLFLAFADSPAANLAVRRALVPALIWTILAELLARRWINAPTGWWTYPSAFLAAASPPVVLIGLTFTFMSIKRWR